MFSATVYPTHPRLPPPQIMTQESVGNSELTSQRSGRVRGQCKVTQDEALQCSRANITRVEEIPVDVLDDHSFWILVCGVDM